MENTAEKLKKLKTLRTWNKVYLPLFIIVAALLGLSAGIYPGLWVFIAAGIVMVFAVFAWKVGCRLEVYAQATMVYKLPELQESGEWEKYCTTVDYKLEKAIK